MTSSEGEEMKHNCGCWNEIFLRVMMRTAKVMGTLKGVMGTLKGTRRWPRASFVAVVHLGKGGVVGQLLVTRLPDTVERG
jgi:hypothetical protein